MFRSIKYRPATKGALTHTTVVGITVTLVGALHEILPDVPDRWLFIAGMVMAVLGFAGLYFTVNQQPPPQPPEEDDT